MEDTIAAISTAMTPSGIGIVRISGSKALDIIAQVYRSKGGRKKIREVPTHTIHYGYIYDDEELIDEVLVMVMHGPRTYTGEDTVEIDCHGGIYAMQRVLDVVLHHGARIAEPGEFTKRAFLNGKMDLSQAEAVMDVIQSKNQYALKSSMNQLKGSLQRPVEEIRESLLYEIAYIESALDDPEHISLDGYKDRLEQKLLKQKQRIRQLLDTASDGKILQEGIKTVIIGKPNAGKSSLLNFLTGENRAIVTEVEGTTRDILEEYVSLGGITLKIVDTAGIRSTEDIVEKIGVKRAIENAKDADLILCVLDSSKPLDDNDREIMRLLEGRKAIVLYNKTDLAPEIELIALEREICHPVIPISAKEEQGMEALIQNIKDMFFKGEIHFNDEVYITNARHRAALEEAYDSLTQVQSSLEMGMPEDFLSIDLMGAYEALGRILGKSVGEDLVNEIFSKFCMGK
ncbi:MAG: tRNA uridine-5-carboxymethylaminomethyl(34) synthesis GTPase MnmE [Eubacteriales bacterium]|nr:tRNA uridine-5-carboxymethylaminomethyl(34) synthesis GTPase MnmE [Eubacteriales bacterium]